MKVRLYDNKGTTIDRYTAIFDIVIDGEYPYLGFNDYPFHGIGQHGSTPGLIDEPGHDLGERILFDNLPTIDAKKFVAQEFISLSLFPDESGRRQTSRYEVVNQAMILKFIVSTYNRSYVAANYIAESRPNELEDKEIVKTIHFLSSSKAENLKELETLFKMLNCDVPKYSILYNLRTEIVKVLAQIL